MKRFFKIIAYFGIIFLIILLLPKILAYLLGTPYPLATVSSSSMWPVLKRGDLVFVKKAPKEGIKKEEIVVYQGEEGFIIHRVVRVEGGIVVTKGDANEEEDKPITFDKIQGRVPKIAGKLVKIPYLGYITFIVRKPPPEAQE